MAWATVCSPGSRRSWSSRHSSRLLAPTPAGSRDWRTSTPRSRSSAGTPAVRSPARSSGSNRPSSSSNPAKYRHTASNSGDRPRRANCSSSKNAKDSVGDSPRPQSPSWAVCPVQGVSPSQGTWLAKASHVSCPCPCPGSASSSTGFSNASSLRYAPSSSVFICNISMDCSSPGDSFKTCASSIPWVSSVAIPLPAHGSHSAVTSHVCRRLSYPASFSAKNNTSTW